MDSLSKCTALYNIGKLNVNKPYNQLKIETYTEREVTDSQGKQMIGGYR